MFHPANIAGANALAAATRPAASPKSVFIKKNRAACSQPENATCQNAEADKITAFHQYLAGRGVQTNIRRSWAKDIDATCGQLANKEKAGVA